MKAIQRRSRLLLPTLLAAVTLHAQKPPTPELPNYRQLRADAARDLTQPFDWLSLVALEWLKPGLTTVGSAPGNTLVLPATPAHLVTLEQKDGIVTVRAADPSLQLGSASVSPGTVLPPNKEELQDALAAGTVRLWAIDRNGKRYLRVKNSNAPARLHFTGLHWYPPDPAFRITARYTPYPTPRTLTTHNEIGQTYTTPLPGYVEFTVNGTTEKLFPFTASDKDGLFFVFRDDTYRTTTYGGGRFLTTEAPSHGIHQPGTVILDFNQADNPPCAYTPFATCPLASPENRLPVPIPAGEKRYHD